MPDDDIVHDKLRRRYLKLYAVLCKGQLTIEEMAQSVLHALKGDVRKTGDAPMRLAKRLAVHIERLGGCRTDVDWAAIPFPTYDAEVTLWSGGLDALTGLYSRAYEMPSLNFYLVGSGGNDSVLARQKRVVEAFDPVLHRHTVLYRVPIRLNDNGLHHKNSCPRARGVVFCLIGAACAYLQGQRGLMVYENGIGAINLPYRASELGLDHSRSVHPLTLMLLMRIIDLYR